MTTTFAGAPLLEVERAQFQAHHETSLTGPATHYRTHDFEKSTKASLEGVRRETLATSLK